MKSQKNNFHMVRQYDAIIPKEVCEALIEIFEVNTQGHQKINSDYKPSFTQLNINEHVSSLVSGLVQYTKEAYDKYVADISSPYIPRMDYMEEFRIKRRFLRINTSTLSIVNVSTQNIFVPVFRC